MGILGLSFWLFLCSLWAPLKKTAGAPHVGWRNSTQAVVGDVSEGILKGQMKETLQTQLLSTCPSKLLGPDSQGHLLPDPFLALLLSRSAIPPWKEELGPA